MQKDEHDIYLIPPNFIDGGTIGGLFRTRNVIEAGILAAVIGLPVLSLHLSLTTRIIILCLTALPLIKAGPLPAACHVADGQRLCRSGSRFIGSGKPERPAAACKNLHAFPGG